MLLPTMTIEEIRRDLLKDYPILVRKIEYHRQELNRKLNKHQIPKGYAECFDYISKQKNRWIYRLEIDKKGCDVRFITFYHTGRGYVGIVINEDGHLMIHTAHFFNRYNERCALGLFNIFDIAKAFLNENFQYVFHPLEQYSSEVSTFFGNVDSGIILGTLNKKLNMAKINTFLLKESLSQNQKELQQELIISSRKYRDSSDNLLPIR